MHKKLRPMMIALPIAMAAFPALSKDKTPDIIALDCSGCHRVGGLDDRNNHAPNLAGMDENYLFKQLMAFKSGKRSHALMTYVAGEYSEAEAVAIAHYYAKLKKER